MTNLEGRYYADIGEVFEALSATEANTKLKEGYELLGLKERTTEMMATGGPIIRSEPVYILGKGKKSVTPQQAGTPSSGTTAYAATPFTEDDLKDLPWQKSTKVEGDWIPSKEVPPEAKAFMETKALNKTGKSHVWYVGDHAYYLTKDSGNLQRFVNKK